VLQAASGKPAAYIKVVRVGQSKYSATHAASETGELACGTWTRLWSRSAPTWPRSPAGAAARTSDSTPTRTRTAGLEALFVLSITLGLRPGELRKLAWDHVDLDNAVIHVWRSASRTGDVKTPKSRRSLELPRRCVCRNLIRPGRSAIGFRRMPHELVAPAGPLTAA